MTAVDETKATGTGLTAAAKAKTTIGATYVTGPYTIALSGDDQTCLLYTSPSPRDRSLSRMPSSA